MWQTGITEVTATLSSYVDAGDLNSGPSACSANISPTTPSPAPDTVFFFLIRYSLHLHFKCYPKSPPYPPPPSTYLLLWFSLFPSLLYGSEYAGIRNIEPWVIQALSLYSSDAWLIYWPWTSGTAKHEYFQLVNKWPFPTGLLMLIRST